MTRHRIAQIGENRNPNRQKTDPEPAVSCKNGYFRPAAPPPGSTAWRFFTADAVVAASEMRRLQERVRELERLLGRKTMEVEILKEALDLARAKNRCCCRPRCRRENIP